MTHDEGIQAARTVAEKIGWPWAQPLLAETGLRLFLFGRRYWRVTTNTKYAVIGQNVRVLIDDTSGRILANEYTAGQDNGSSPQLHNLIINRTTKRLFKDSSDSPACG